MCVTVAIPLVPVVAVADEPSPNLNVTVAPEMVCVESSSSSALNVNVCCVFAAVGVLFVNMMLASATVSLPAAHGDTSQLSLVQSRMSLWNLHKLKARQHALPEIQEASSVTFPGSTQGSLPAAATCTLRSIGPEQLGSTFGDAWATGLHAPHL